MGDDRTSGFIRGLRVLRGSRGLFQTTDFTDRTRPGRETFAVSAWESGNAGLRWVQWQGWMPAATAMGAFPTRRHEEGRNFLGDSARLCAKSLLHGYGLAAAEKLWSLLSSDAQRREFGKKWKSNPLSFETPH